MLLAQEYAPDLTNIKDKFVQTPLGLLFQGQGQKAINRLGSDAQVRVQAMSNPEAALQTGMDFMGSGLLGTIKNLGKGQTLLNADQYIDRVYKNFPEFKEAYKKIDKNIAPETSMEGRVLNTDVARELFPEYVQNRTRSADVHEGASTFTKELYADKLRNPTPEGLDPVVTFTAGGTGSGKTTGLRMFGNDKSEMIYDTNMGNFESAKKKIDQALNAGREVDIVYVYRDPVEALRNGSLSRAKNQQAKYGTGRTVPLKEHLKTHTGSREVIEQVGKEYANNPKVKINLIDNSKVNPEPTTFDKLPKIDKNKVSKKLSDALEDMYKNNVITKEIYESSK